MEDFHSLGFLSVLFVKASDFEAFQSAIPRETLLAGLTQAAVILGDGFLVALRDSLRVAAAHLAGILVVELPAQLQFQLIYIGKHLRMQLLDERGVAGEAAGVEAFHLLNEFLDFLGSFGVFADGLAKLIQIAQRIVIGALRRNRRIVREN